MRFEKLVANINGSRMKAVVGRNAPLRLLCASILLGVAVSSGAAQVLVVDANLKPCTRGSAHYTTIQAAVNAAASGSTVLVCPGTYPEQITISTPLTLRGLTSSNHGAATITLPAAGLASIAPSGTYLDAQVLVLAPNVTLDSLVVDAGGTVPPPNGCAIASLSGINFNSGSSGTINRVILRNQAQQLNQSGFFCGAAAIEVTSTTVGTVTIQNSALRAFGETGLWSFGTVVVRNNVWDSGLGLGDLNNGTGGFAAQAMYLGGVSTVSGNIISQVGVGIACACLTGSSISSNTVAADEWGIYAAGPGITVTSNTVTPGVQNPVTFSDKTGIVVVGLGATVRSNRIVGVTYGIVDWGSPTPSTPDTIQSNTITDAQVGITGAAGNAVSGNTFIGVTTLLQ